ncbi:MULTISPECIES: effector binding domain-containing protein [Paenibacillus]|uniref:Transcriptional regulator YdeE n=1 Tax=Paenibacillus lactis TaxID=228574 RepID=A0ABS4F7G8_9BACL|nr:effector binding domain-containing protein [Paenibacillus lactis]MBP1892210.1 putative transcriptional regulator YdeE [Paenibacillus lactis]HAG01157.1 AraC family transcriptional regulator [Paenibacillus lactis]
MSAQQRNEAALTTKEAFQAVGLKWEGTFADAAAGGIRAVHRQLQERLEEIPHAIHKDTMLGLSYHAFPGGEGFIHYAAVEVEKLGKVPDGMVNVSVPTLTYAACQHSKEQAIEASYTNIYNWIKEQGYKEYSPDHLTHFEKYPMSQDPYDDHPEFVIMIPVET